ncbi:MAG: succinyl-diaminopimelate desuccinylase [bacterium]|nr:succinyl-diaminopimelate desuccinylase [bacterium]
MTVLDTLCWLVDIPSPTGQEGRLCEALSRRLGSTYARDHVRRVGKSLVVGPRTGRPLLLLVGHIDTVPPQGQGPAQIEGGRLLGLGTSDMKSGVAVMVHLLEEEMVREGPFDVVGVFYDAEEGPDAGNGLEPVLQELSWLSEAEFAVVLEPTDLELQLGCQGTANATVRFEGKTAHSARPWLGENAITKAGAWLADLHERQPEEHVVSGLSFFEVFSVTQASAGLARNVIPGTFDLHLNYRFPPNVTPEAARRRLSEIAAPADAVEVHEIVPGAPVPEGNPHLDRLIRATSAPLTPKQAWTDVARLARYGVPAVNYGPGEVAQAHQATESVPIAYLDPAYEALLGFLTEAPSG